jgi:hypothetical protein
LPAAKIHSRGGGGLATSALLFANAARYPACDLFGAESLCPAFRTAQSAVPQTSNLYQFYGDDFRVECPTGSGQYMNLFKVAKELARRLSAIFLLDNDGKRPSTAGRRSFRKIRIGETTFFSTSTSMETGLDWHLRLAALAIFSAPAERRQNCSTHNCRSALPRFPRWPATFFASDCSPGQNKDMILALLSPRP